MTESTFINQKETTGKTNREIVGLFRKAAPVSVETKNTSHGEEDYREVWFVDFGEEKLVIKLAENGFTDEAHLELWAKIAEKYRELGYYCPRFIKALDGRFPVVDYHGHWCIVHGEEYSPYISAEKVLGKWTKGYYPYFREAVLMNARVAAQRYDFTGLPSGYCMFELFEAGDTVDETTEDALKWKKEADRLPEKFAEQTNRIWENWKRVREELRKIYFQLPTSVFQADINYSNVLLDEAGNFKGVYDFNLGGREVFLNLLFREIPYICTGDEAALLKEDFYADSIKDALLIAREVYSFNVLERQAAPLLYRCIKPLWWYSAVLLRKAAGAEDKIQRCLDFIEYEQGREIDFERYM